MTLKKQITRYFYIAVYTLSIFVLFWFSRSYLGDSLHRIYRATGDTAFILLIIILLIGPLSRLQPKRFAKYLSWRHELGGWFTVTALTHYILIICNWFEHDIYQIFGYRLIEGGYKQISSGMGAATTSKLFLRFSFSLLEMKLAPKLQPKSKL